MTGNPLLDALFYLHTQNMMQQQAAQSPHDPYAGMNATEGASPNAPVMIAPNTGGYSIPYHLIPNRIEPPSQQR